MSRVIFGAIIVFLLSLASRYTLYSQIGLHTDRQTYSSGDTLWFSATDFSLLNTQRGYTLYVEISNEKQTLGERIFELSGGQASGFWPLSDTLLRGPYRLRAYTRSSAMQNQFASELFWIVSAQTKLTIPSAADSLWKMSIQPEAGALVADLPASVVVRIQDAEGIPIAAECRLVHPQNGTIALCQTDSQGLGKLFFTPQPQIKYSLETVSKVGKIQSRALPTSVLIGVRMHIDGVSFPGLFSIKVFRTPIESYRKLSLVIYAGDSLLTTLNDSTLRAVWLVKIPKKDLSRGLLRFVLTDAYNNIQAFRLVWNDLPDLPVISLNSKNHQVHSQIKDTKGQLLHARLSMSITDSLFEGFRNENRPTNTIRYLLSEVLVSEWQMGELKPEWIDNLLIINVEPKATKRDTAFDRGLILEGITTDISGERKPKVKLLLSNFALGEAKETKSDSTGFFYVTVSEANSSFTLTAQQLSEKNKVQNTFIQWLPHPRPSFQKKNSYPGLVRIPQVRNDADATKFTKDGQTLETVTIRAKRVYERDKVVSDFKIQVDEQLMQQSGSKSALTLLNYLLANDGRFMRIANKDRPARTSGGYSAYMKAKMNEPISDPFMKPFTNATILIDDRNYFDQITNQLMALPIEDVESIEMVRQLNKPVAGVSKSSGPIVSIITRSGKYGKGEFSVPGQIKNKVVESYVKVPSFQYNPQKATLFWHPDLQSEGSGIIELPSNAHKKTIYISIEGVTVTGAPFSYHQRLKLE